MSFFSDCALGIRSFYHALRFIFHHKLQWYAIFPAICMLLLFQLGAIISSHALTLEARTTNGIIWLILIGFVEIGLGIVLMDFTKYLIVIVLSPLLTHLSARTERISTGKSFPFTWAQFRHDIQRAIQLAFRNMLWQYSLLAVLIALGYFIWSAPFSSPLIVVMYCTSFFYYGFSFLDYSLERKKFSIPQSVHFVRKHRGLALTIGATYSLLILVPVDFRILLQLEGFKSMGFWMRIVEFIYHLFLWLAAAFAPIIAIISATLASQKI